MSVGRRVEFEFRVRSCALYAKQQSLPFQFADLEDSPYVSMSDQGERQSTTLFTTTALRRQLLEANMDGLELQRRLRETEEKENRALQSGAVAFLRKPVSKEALLRVIHMGTGKPRLKSRQEL